MLLATIICSIFSVRVVVMQPFISIRKGTGFDKLYESLRQINYLLIASLHLLQEENTRTISDSIVPLSGSIGFGKRYPLCIAAFIIDCYLLAVIEQRNPS